METSKELEDPLPSGYSELNNFTRDTELDEETAEHDVVSEIKRLMAPNEDSFPQVDPIPSALKNLWGDKEPVMPAKIRHLRVGSELITVTDYGIKPENNRVASIRFRGNAIQSSGTDENDLLEYVVSKDPSAKMYIERRSLAGEEPPVIIPEDEVLALLFLLKRVDAKTGGQVSYRYFSAK